MAFIAQPIACSALNKCNGFKFCCRKKNKFFAPNFRLSVREKLQTNIEVHCILLWTARLDLLSVGLNEKRAGKKDKTGAF